MKDENVLLVVDPREVVVYAPTSNDAVRPETSVDDIGKGIAGSIY